MADNKTYTISFQVDGLTGEVKNVEQFTKKMKDAEKQTKKTAEEATIFGDIKGKFNNLIAPIKKVIMSMRTLSGAIAATGIGLFVVALGTLVAYFKTSEEGSKKLSIAMETLSLLFGELTTFASDLGEKLIGVFKNPKEALADFGNLLKEKVFNVFEGLVELIPNLAKSIGLLFKGQFKAAGKVAFDAVAKVTTGTENASEKLIEFGEKAVEYYEEKIVPAVKKAIATADQLVTAQRNLRDLQQKLTVENAQLNQELEAQRKIAEDTTLTYDERAAALEEVGKIQVQLAKNVANQAKAEEDLLKVQIANEGNYEKREELETQLAEATAARIDAQTALNTVEQEAGKLGRELDQDELDRKRSIRDIIEELNKEELDNAFEQARQELEIAERLAMEELDGFKATDAEKTAAAAGFAKKREKIADEEAAFKMALAKQVAENDLALASSALGAIQELLGENSKANKAFAIAQTTIDTYLGAQRAYNSQLTLTPDSPVRAAIAAGVAVASGLARVKAIAQTTPGSTPSKPSVPSFNPQTAINIPQAGNNTVTPEGQTVVKAYVVSSDMTNAQEADKKINDLAKL